MASLKSEYAAWKAALLTQYWPRIGSLISTEPALMPTAVYTCEAWLGPMKGIHVPSKLR